jgi:hypothetical protein
MVRDGFGFDSLLGMRGSEFQLWFATWEAARKAEADAMKAAQKKR